MSTRRGFFAFIGNAAVTGLVAHRASATAPTLILPPAGLVEPATAIPAAFPLQAAQPSQMDALLHVKRMTPQEFYFHWLEGGLRGAKRYNGQTEEETEARIEAAMAEHGSLIAAMRAGAI